MPPPLLSLSRTNTSSLECGPLLEPTETPSCSRPTLVPDLHKWGTLPVKGGKTLGPELPGRGRAGTGGTCVPPFGRGSRA